MKKKNTVFLSLLTLVIITVLISCGQQATNKELSLEQIDFKAGWEFNKDEEASKSTKINIPHTSRIEPLVVNDQWQGTMWYRKDFEFNETTAGKKVFLKFEGVMHESDVWLNEVHLTHHIGGYLPFVVDLSNEIKKGKNTIKVKVSNSDNTVIPPGKPLKELDFNYYGGIYRDVELVVTNDIYITDPILADKIGGGGILVHFSEVSSESARCEVKIEVENESGADQAISAIVSLKDATGKIVSSQESAVVEVKSSSAVELPISFKVERPVLWNTTEPHLYTLTTELYSDNQKMDSISQKVGIRKIALTDEGFFLNDDKIYIKGTNRHQEYPHVGYAISNEANYRDAVKIKQAGFDFVRLSHYPQDEAFLDACDELGIMVMNAIPGWQFYQEGEFVENSYKDIREMVRRDRNHASVVFWETSLNESGMTEEYMVTANKILKEELPYEDTYSAGWVDHSSFDLFIPARQHSKPPNYWKDYNNGNRKIFIAEYGDWEYYAQNAGFNQKAFKNLEEEERTSRQLRESGEKRLLQQAFNFQEAANSNRQGEHTIGDANWLMFDYNRGYADDLESSGISDIYRIPKYAYYFYQSQRPSSELIQFKNLKIGGPMVKIASDWNKDSATDIKVYSNCDEVALFLNGNLIAKHKTMPDAYSSSLLSPPFTFHIDNYSSGDLEAKGYINSVEVCSDKVVTAAEASRIEVSLDLSGVEVGENDIVILNASIFDADGHLITTDNHTKVHFEIAEGAAVLIGENPSTAKAGIASILIKISGADLPIKLIAKNETLGDFTANVE